MEVWSTRYRRAVHKFGEAWITIDGQKVVTMGTMRSENEFYITTRQLLQERDHMDVQDTGEMPQEHDVRRNVYDDATKIIHGRSVFSSWDLTRSLFVYLNLNIEDAWNSENDIIRAFAVLDRRFGKRRLAGLEITSQHPLVQQLATFRCQAEGVTINTSKMAAT